MLHFHQVPLIQFLRWHMLKSQMVQERKKSKSTLPSSVAICTHLYKTARVVNILQAYILHFTHIKTIQIQVLTFSSQMETEWKQDSPSIFSHSLHTIDCTSLAQSAALSFFNSCLMWNEGRVVIWFAPFYINGDLDYYIQCDAIKKLTTSLSALGCTSFHILAELSSE